MDEQQRTEVRSRRGPSAGSITKISLPLPFRSALKAIESAFVEEGYELLGRVKVSDVIKSRVGTDVDPAEMLVFIHPVVAFQSLVTGEDAMALLPVLISVKATAKASCSVGFHSAWSEAEVSEDALTRLLAGQSRELLNRVIRRLRPAA